MRWERVVGEGSSVSHSTHRCHSHPWSPVAGDSPLYLPSSGSWLTSAEEGGGRERRENWNNHIGLGTCLDHAQSTNQILSRWCNDLIRKLLYTQCPQTLAVLSPYPSNKYWQRNIEYPVIYLLFLLLVCLEVRVVTGELLCDWGYLGGLTHWQ